jgi:hypothetical protein
MGSTLTGNYDVCLELAEEQLVKLIAYTLTGYFPQPITIADFYGKETVDGLEAQLLIYVGGATINFTSTSAAIDTRSPYCLLSLPLTDFTVDVISSQFPVTDPSAGTTTDIGHTTLPLAGTVFVSVPFKLAPPGSTVVMMDFTDPSVTVNVALDAASQQEVRSTFSAFGADPVAVLAKVIATTLSSSLRTIDLPGTTFNWQPNQNGTLNPLQFADMGLVTLLPASGRPGVLAVLGTVLQSHVAAENRSFKILAATDASHQASVTISPEAFRDLIFGPALASQAGLPANNIAALCPCCGTAESVGIGGLNFTRFCDTLNFGQINFQGAGNTSGTGWTANVSFDAHATLTLNSGNGGPTIVPTSKLDDVSVGVSLDWWVWLGSVVIGPIGWAIDAVVQSVLSSVVSNAVQNGLSKALQNLGGTQLGAPNGFIADAVEVIPGGIILQGHIKIKFPRIPRGGGVAHVPQVVPVPQRAVSRASAQGARRAVSTASVQGRNSESRTPKPEVTRSR